MKPFPRVCKTTPSDEVRRARIKLRDAPAVLYKLTGVKRGRKTIYNWMIEGKRSYAGVRVKLEYEKVFDEYFTTRAHIENFLDELEK